MQARLPSSVQVIPDNIDGARRGQGGKSDLSRASRRLHHLGPQCAGCSDPAAARRRARLRSRSPELDLQHGDRPLRMPVRRIAGEIGRRPAGAVPRAVVKFTSTGPASTAYSATKIATSLLGIRSQIIAGYKGTNDYVVAAMRGDGDAAICSLTALAHSARASSSGCLPASRSAAASRRGGCDDAQAARPRADLAASAGGRAAEAAAGRRQPPWPRPSWAP